MKYINLTKEEQTIKLNELLKEFDEIKKENLNINMKRGVPSLEQIDISKDILDVLKSDSNHLCEGNVDAFNYGCPYGIEEGKKLMAEMMDVDKKDVVLFGNSSLNIMYNLISNAYTHGVLGSTPWCKLDKPVKWLCVVPGYDRHFSITEYFGIEMINIPLHKDGPDIDLINKYLEDEYVKGIWCVPIYSNPSGVTYSDDVVKRFANLKPKAKDFRIYWDLAYIVHHLDYENHDEILNLLKESNYSDYIYMFASTSKISLAGAGISAVASSQNNIEEIKKIISLSTVGYDKINELRHVLYFKDIDGIKNHMIKHGTILKPKFEMINDILKENLNEVDDVYWTNPKGGYFISLEVNGIAKEVVKRCEECGIYLTPSGSSYPYHLDPNNSNIRLAPSFPNIKVIKKAMEVLSIAIKIEYLYKLIS